MFSRASAPRYFGVTPGRQLFRTAQTRLSRGRGLVAAHVRLNRVVLSAQWHEWYETFRLEGEAGAVWRRREQALRQLGETVHHGGEIDAARVLVAKLDEQLLQVGWRMRQAQEIRQRRIAGAWGEEGPTMIEHPPVEPPGPPLVPEPEPVPHEPPGPVIVPEPEPVPHVPPQPQ